MKKIALVIPFKEFRDEEFFICFEKLKKENFLIKIVSDEEGIAIGADGGDIEVDLKINLVNVNDFDALIFIGGPGCLKRLNNEQSYHLIKEAFNLNKTIAAICISPVILAESGILKEKKATVWSNSFDKTAIKTLKENGALYQDKNIVVDDNIITGNGPSSISDFSEIVISKINN